MASILSEQPIGFPDFGVVASPAVIFMLVPCRVPFHGGVDLIAPLLVLEAVHVPEIGLGEFVAVRCVPFHGVIDRCLITGARHSHGHYYAAFGQCAANISGAAMKSMNCSGKCGTEVFLVGRRRFRK